MTKKEKKPYSQKNESSDNIQTPAPSNETEALAKLPPDESKKYEPDIKRLIEYLTGAKINLEQKKGELEEKIMSLNKTNRASNAYGNAMFLALQAAEE